MTILVLVGLGAAAAALYGGGNLIVHRNGERWAAEAEARAARRA